MGINKYKKTESTTHFGQKDIIKIGIVLVFFTTTSIVAVVNGYTVSSPVILIFATVIGVYVVLNIGVNDVGHVVGLHAITLPGAIITCREVVDTIKSWIISPNVLSDSKTFIYVMLATLTSGVLWLHIATALGAPVSTMHSLVGGVLGTGLMAGEFGIANWVVMGGIVISWVISPLLGGVVAVTFLVVIKRFITYKSDRRVVVPLLIFVMICYFSIYLVEKTSIFSISVAGAILYGLLIAIAMCFIAKPLIARKSQNLPNTKGGINELFTMPLVLSVALLSFAYVANGVSNVISPLAGIYEDISNIKEDVALGSPSMLFWIMLIGGLGISLGLALYGPRLIKTVVSGITDLDKMHAFCVALSVAITVLIASHLGLPVSSTHVAIGAIFGVGFLREYLKRQYYRMRQQIIEAHRGKDEATMQKFLDRFQRASLRQKKIMLESIKNIRMKSSNNKKKIQKDSLLQLRKKEVKYLQCAYR